MKKVTVLLALLALSTSAWADVGACGYNPCGNPCPSPCWNPCCSPCYNPCGIQDSSYSCTSDRQCTKPLCGPVIGIQSCQTICGFTGTGCMGSFGTFISCGHTHVCGLPCGGGNTQPPL